MRREELVDLNAFVTVAEEQSFRRATAKLGTSQSALNHTLRRLEAQLGVRLLTRTTRRVALTEAGERLLVILGPRSTALPSTGECGWSVRLGARTRRARVRVRVDEQFVVNTVPLMVQAVAHVRAGRFAQVLEDWCPPF